jgi:hypothetical protein
VAVLPPYKVSQEDQDRMRDIARRLALRLGVVGLMNVQFALKDGRIYVLEVNPRASRTVPFIAKAVGVPLVKIAVAAMAGKTLEELGFTEEPKVPGIFVKAPVFPFRRFPGVDPVLGPEMKATSCRSKVRPSSPCTIATSLACCRSQGASPTSASSWPRPPARPTICAPRASPYARSSRSTKPVRTWSTT